MRARLILAAAAAVVAAAGGGVAVAATTSAPATQPTANSVYACVTSSGKVDYLEFRGILPHACNPGDTLWSWVAKTVPLVSPTAHP